MEEEEKACWLIKVVADDFDNAEFTEMTVPDAQGMLKGFQYGGSELTMINGGWRITTPTGHWDLIHKPSLDHNWRYTGE